MRLDEFMAALQKEVPATIESRAPIYLIVGGKPVAFTIKVFKKGHLGPGSVLLQPVDDA